VSCWGAPQPDPRQGQPEPLASRSPLPQFVPLSHTFADPARGPGAAREAGVVLSSAMDALAEAAKDVHRHRAAGDLMGMTD
jgi:hypothetical protein